MSIKTKPMFDCRPIQKKENTVGEGDRENKTVIQT